MARFFIAKFRGQCFLMPMFLPASEQRQNDSALSLEYIIFIPLTPTLSLRGW